MLRVLQIIDGTIVDGPGLRTAIYFAGCNHQCPGCHNPQSWDFEGGEPTDMQTIIDHIKENDFDVTLTGGDPLYQIESILPLCQEIKKLGKNIWLYTGFTIEEIRASERFSPILSVVDTIVDGPFVESLKDLSLPFRGSSNQRIINL